MQTVAVPIFENRSFERELEFELTEALIKEIELRTPYKVTRGGRADTMLSGSILSVERRTLTRSTATGLDAESQVQMIVSFEWKDLRTGEILRSRKSVQAEGRHVVTRPVGEPVEVARHEAVARISRRLVSLMRDDW